MLYEILQYLQYCTQCLKYSLVGVSFAGYLSRGSGESSAGVNCVGKLTLYSVGFGMGLSRKSISSYMLGFT